MEEQTMNKKLISVMRGWIKNTESLPQLWKQMIDDKFDRPPEAPVSLSSLGIIWCDPNDQTNRHTFSRPIIVTQTIG